MELIAMESHNWKDPDIEKAIHGIVEDTLQTIEIHIKPDTEAIILSRDDVIALAEYFDIVKLI